MRLRPGFATALLLGSASAWIGWSWMGSAAAGPEFSLSTPIEMGILAHDEQKSVVVEFRNTGSAVLEIGQPLTGCTCTTSRLSKARYEPGETGSIEFVYQAAQYPGTSVEQVVIVPTNCAVTPNRSVVLRGRMRGALLPIPAALNVADVGIGQSWERTVEIRHTTEGLKFAILNAASSQVVCKVVSDSTLSDKHIIRVSSEGSVKSGVHRGQISIQTDLPDQSNLEIPFSVDVRSQLRVVPSPLLLQRNPAGGQYADETLTVHGIAGFDVTLAAENPRLNLDSLPTPEEDEPLRRFRVRVATEASVIERGTLELRIQGVPHETSLQVPFIIVP